MKSVSVKCVILRRKGLLVLFFAVYLLYLASMISLSYSMLRIISLVTEYNNPQYLKTTIILSATTLIVLPLSGYLTDSIMFSIVRNFRNDLTNLVFFEILRADYEYNNSKKESYYLSVFLNDIKSLGEDFLVSFLEGIGYIFLLIGSLLYLCYLSWILALAIFVASAIIFTYPFIDSKSLEIKRKEMTDSQERFVDKIKDSIGFLSLIKIYSIQKKEFEEVRSYNENQTGAYVKFNRRRVLVSSISSGLGAVAQMGSFGLGIYLTTRGIMTVAGVISSVQTMNYVLQSFNGIMRGIVSLIGAKALIKKIDGYLQDDTKQQAKENSLGSDSFDIEVKNLCFSYSDVPVVDNLSFSIRQSEKVLLKGDSGRGKTTVLKLLCGLFSSYSGNILIDGKEVRTIDESLYNHCLLVQQECMLFHDTIRNNITLGMDYDAQKYEKVLKTVGLDKELKCFPDGDNEIVFDNGKNISGGQRQRIGLARALMRNPSLLLLDEAFSALDKRSENQIRERIFRLPCTVVEVSHSASVNEEIYSKVIRL